MVIWESLRYSLRMDMSPSLLIQIQRMGDLVLTFPLMARLRELEPLRPVWVLAEPKFYEQLMPLTPSGITYMPPDMVEPIIRTPLHRIVNLSHRETATSLSSKAVANERYGFYRTPDNALHSAGPWALYRASLAHNNRHNRMHWADLNCLDCLPPAAMDLSIWPQLAPPRGSGRVGLFVGASEREKRPEAAFWGELAARLVRRGIKPVFLGGPDDVGLAASAARAAGLSPSSNLAGKFSLVELAAFFSTLDIVVTPDTGPMHVSAWVGTLTLNLSMGPVNPWETAPSPPGHYVLRPTISCTGCWRCAHTAPFCHTAFVPGRVAGLVQSLLQGGDAARLTLPGLALFRTARSGRLGVLAPVRSGPPAPRDLLGEFWKEWFLSVLGGAPHHFALALNQLGGTAFPPMLHTEAGGLSAALSREIRGKRHERSLRDSDFWLHLPPLIRPLGGFVHMVLQNGEFGPAALEDALALTARFGDDLQGQADSGILPLHSVGA